MDDGFYTTDYADGGGGGYYDGGGGIADQYYYDPSTGGVLDTGLQQQQTGSDLVGTFFDYYSGQGYDDQTALQLAVQDAAPSIVQETTTAPYAPPSPPDVSLPDQTFFPLPYNYWQSPPYIPTFPEIPAPQAPGLPPSPASSQPNLPPACPGGQYHPYPIGHPQQNICVPFPVATTNQPQPQPSPAPQAPKPPAQQQQQQCPTGYYRDVFTGQCKPLAQQQCPSGYYRASNGQCLPIQKCTTPGTVFDQSRGICVPQGQAISPLPTGVGGLLDDLKNLPWWVWLAVGGLFLLSRGEERTTTVRYRRAT